MSNGRIPDEVIAAVLKHHDIVDVVGKYVHLSKQGHYMKGLCPFHSEKTPSFTVTPEKQIFHCYGCHAGGSVIAFLMKIEGYHFGEAIRQLAEEAGIPIGWETSTPEQTEQQKENAKLLEAYALSARWYQAVLKTTAQGKPAMEYLRSRGFSDKLIDFFQLGFAPPMWDKLAQALDKYEYSLPLMEKGGLLSRKTDGGFVDKFRERVMFPIHDAKGRVIAFGGRAMGDAQPKYLNSPETALFNKSRSLYNFHNARPAIRKTRQAILFEGYVDVIKAWDAGVDNGVATLGTALTEQHADILRRQAEQIVVCYDGDDAGQAAAYKSIPLLEKAGMSVRIAMLPERKDPDEFITAYGADRFRREVIEAAVPAVYYKLLYIRRNFNLQDDAERIRYIRTAAKLIAELASPVEREHYMKVLAEQFPMTSIETIRQETNEARQLFLKKRENGDNKADPWNNVMNNTKRVESAPAAFPAYHRAERTLLAAMMTDGGIADTVRGTLGDGFNVEAHAALAAYLYAYYAQGNEADATRFMAGLHDEGLESTASALLNDFAEQAVSEQVIADCMAAVQKQYEQRDTIKLLREQAIRADRSGDAIAAAKLWNEIIALEKRQKLS